ncbi:MAG: CaiB/BaiF CoA transferase family protein [Candidatus Geothermarchaeales archaeon]
MDAMVGILQGFRVLDFTQAMAGPFCTMMLADMGAEVIKIERPKVGDVSRQWISIGEKGKAIYYNYVNRNKKSVTLNLKSKKGREIAYKLLREADVAMENFRPGVMKGLGLDYETARGLNPRIIYCSISGYGQDDPRGGWDLIAQGEWGLISITGSDEDHMAKVGVPIADIGAGMYSAYAIALALLHREKTGRGQRIDVALLDTIVSWMTYWMGICYTTGEEIKPIGIAHPMLAPYEAFKAKDNRLITLGVGNDKLWRKFCQVAGIEGLADDPRFATNEDRVKNHDALVPIVSQIIATRESEEWIKTMLEVGIPCARINRVSDVLRHPDVIRRNMVREMEIAPGNKILMAGIPIKFSETAGEVRDPPPRLGQHTDEVLRWLGYSDREIEELREKGVI